MLTITPAQMQAFDTDVKQRFLAKQVSIARERHRGCFAAANDATLRQVVAALHSRARGHRLDWMLSLERFVDFAAQLSPNFDADPAFHDWLGTFPARKVDRAFLHMREALPAETLDRMAGPGSGAGWFLPNPLKLQARRSRLERALPTALATRQALDNAAGRTVVEAGCRRAAAMGLVGEDAAWLLSAATLLVAPEFPNGAVPAWARDWRMRADLPERRRVQALRDGLRAATGLWL